MLCDQTAIPPLVSQAEIDAFNGRYTDENEIDVGITSAFNKFANYINAASAQVSTLKKKFSEGSRSSENMSRIQEDHLLLMFEGVAALGLRRWAPDVVGDANSMYNLVHERIAIFTFRQVSMLFGYNFMSNNIAMAQKPTLMTSLYRNFVFHYIRTLVKKEARHAGRVERDSKMKSAYDRRESVRTFPQRIDASF